MIRYYGCIKYKMDFNNKKKYLQSNDITGICPTFESFFVHFVTIEVTSLISIRIYMLIIIIGTCRRYGLFKQNTTWCPKKCQ